MRHGKMHSGNVILTKVQFTDTFEIKIRPAVVLFEGFDNIVIAGITSNRKMKGIPLTRKKGTAKESVIKTNYIFTISKSMISKVLFRLNQKKKRVLYKELNKKIKGLES